MYIYLTFLSIFKLLQNKHNLWDHIFSGDSSEIRININECSDIATNRLESVAKE